MAVACDAVEYRYVMTSCMRQDALPTRAHCSGLVLPFLSIISIIPSRHRAGAQPAYAPGAAIHRNREVVRG